ncbi:MAG: right-handed parallel beta-helix repeat-containing protein [Kiritimatiellae bacterium]|nr:right-handed parallel beta-helix repeat-containing protein [Kiritimatiellia bacterium]MDD5519622.1 right-handed parallel beta-helix repeat-containing protein [Kiritimatiellia bacterium]
MNIILRCFAISVMVSYLLILSSCCTKSTGKIPASLTDLTREIQSGKRLVAHASWWGFDPDNSTKILQAAIDSGVRKLIVNNTGRPWVVDKIQLASDQEIVFERGVVIQAKRGSFKGKADSLFTASLKKNITLNGYGAEFRMWRQDYDDPGQYEHAEWRHTLSIRSCSNVCVYGLILAESGGDGIYLGVARRGITNKDIHIKDVTCIDNYRQGVSVISAENLLMENCILKNTAGTAPMAGIDFEPNMPDEKLVNCVMRNCVSENNKGGAYEFYLKQLTAATTPISVRLENCRSVGCRSAVGISTGDEVGTTAVNGVMEFVNCTFKGSEGTGIAVRGKPAEGCKIHFKNCKLLNCLAGKPDQSPIQISSAPSGADNMGGLTFANCRIIDPVARMPLAYMDMNGDRQLVDITGRLTVECNGQTKVYTLDKKQIDAWFPAQAEIKSVLPFELKGIQWQPLVRETKSDTINSCMVRQRERAGFLLWAESGREVKFVIRVEPVGKGHKTPAKVRIITPSGKETTLAEAVPGQDTSYTFNAVETGAHRLVCEPGSNTARISSSTRQVCAFSETGSMHLLSTMGEFFFYVPAGVKEFVVKVAGDSPGELVKAMLVNPDGSVVEEKDNIGTAHRFHVTRSDTSKGASWSIRFAKPSQAVLEDFYVNLRGIPPVLAGTRETLLIPVK